MGIQNENLTKELPKELYGWNWGAFFLNAVWGIGNKTYIALLVLVPFVNIFMVFLLGKKGNKWAWKNKEWESVEHFKNVQRKWNYAGYAAGAFYVYYVIKEFIAIF